MQAVLQTPEASVDNNPEMVQHMANNMAQCQLLPQIMTQMSQLIQQMNAMQHQINNADNNTIIRQSSSSVPRQHRLRTNTSKYCWSHGAYAHTSQQCRSKKSGHRDDATFTNKLGGSTVYCNNSNTSDDM